LVVKRGELAKAGAGADDNATRALPVSPGPRVDALWHAMLCCTEVSGAVHAALGTVVPHTLRDALRLSPAEKLERRRNALALYARRGWAPVLEFWGEAGAAAVDMHAGDQVTVYESRGRQPAQAVASPMPLGELPSPPAAAADAPPPLAAQAPPPKRMRSGLEPGEPAAAAAAAQPGDVDACGTVLLVAAAGAPPRENEGPPADARPAIMQNQAITISVVAETGKVHGFRVKPATRIGSILHVLAGKLGVNARNMYLLDGGRQLSSDATLAESGIDEGDTLDLFLEQTGC
jgi:hypothetical protein